MCVRCDKSHTAETKFSLTAELDGGERISHELDGCEIVALWLGGDLARHVHHASVLRYEPGSSIVGEYEAKKKKSSSKNEVVFFSPSEEGSWGVPGRRGLPFFRNLHKLALARKPYEDAQEAVLYKAFGEGLDLDSGRADLEDEETGALAVAVISLRELGRYKSGARSHCVTGLALDTPDQLDILDASDCSRKHLFEFFRYTTGSLTKAAGPCPARTQVISMDEHCRREKTKAHAAETLKYLCKPAEAFVELALWLLTKQ